jgi:proteic killer suppression protein
LRHSAQIRSSTINCVFASNKQREEKINFQSSIADTRIYWVVKTRVCAPSGGANTKQYDERPENRQEKALVKCKFTVYNETMIKSFQNKGLRHFFEDDDGRKLPQDMLARIALILSTLHAAQDIEGMDIPTFRLHPLKGEMKGFYSVTVRANWRIIFRFEDGQAFDVDFVDYH